MEIRWLHREAFGTFCQNIDKCPEGMSGLGIDRTINEIYSQWRYLHILYLKNYDIFVLRYTAVHRILSFFIKVTVVNVVLSLVTK